LSPRLDRLGSADGDRARVGGGSSIGATVRTGDRGGGADDSDAPGVERLPIVLIYLGVCRGNPGFGASLRRTGNRIQFRLLVGWRIAAILPCGLLNFARNGWATLFDRPALRHFRFARRLHGRIGGRRRCGGWLERWGSRAGELWRQ